MITVVKAVNPYKPDCGDLVCCQYSAEYLETPPTKLPRDEQVMPLSVVGPNPWSVLNYLGIEAGALKYTYECPYTGSHFYGVVPVALVSKNLDGYRTKKTEMADYWFDHEHHAHMQKDRRFDMSEIQRLLLGSGYTHGTGIHDGSSSKPQTKVNLNNGDYLWVYFCEWHNK